jgi:hypothetical protein
MITWTQLYLQTHQFNEGAIAIASSFVGNVLAIAATTKPEYAESKQIIGYVFQDSGEARKGYALYSGKDILLLSVPETTGLTFFPTTYLSDSYTLDISYASIGNILESNTAPIPDLILELPVRVSEVEASVEGLGLAIESQTETDLSHASRLTALEGTISNPSWGDIGDKPSTFPPDEHVHDISDVTDLSSVLGTTSLSVLDLIERVDALESATPSTSGGVVTTLLSTDTTLESNKRYLATVPNLLCETPPSPAIGDILELQTDNFDLKVAHGNASHQVRNNSTLTTAGTDNGIVLKPFSFIRLMYLGFNLWVSQIKSRTVNNFTPAVIGSTLVKQTYMATAPTPSNGTAVGAMYNGLKGTGSLTNGYLTESTTGDILVTLSAPIIINQLRLCNGQANNGAGINDPYSVRDITVYTGHTTGGENLGTYTFSNTSPTEETKTITPNTETSSTFLLRVNSVTARKIGILELEIWGKTQTGGEVAVS